MSREAKTEGVWGYHGMPYHVIALRWLTPTQSKHLVSTEHLIWWIQQIRNVTIDEVGNVAAFLCSDLASGVTGEITYVDAGYNIIGIGDK